MGNPDGIPRRCRLRDEEFRPAWTSIKLADGVHDRLLAQSPLARGLANQVAKQLPGTRCAFIEVDPHALTSSALGRSQQAVAKLFEQTIPELAMDGVALLLIDKLETFAVSRHQLSLEDRWGGRPVKLKICGFCWQRFSTDPTAKTGKKI